MEIEKEFRVGILYDKGWRVYLICCSDCLGLLVRKYVIASFLVCEMWFYDGEVDLEFS